MAVSDYGTINQRTAAWAADTMLRHAEPVLVLSKFGQPKPLPKNKADNIKFRRPVPFTVAEVPLVEGVAPTAQSMSYFDVPVTLSQYGAVVEITDKVADMAEDPVLKDAAMLCGEQAGETIEYITWGVLKAGSSVGFSNGDARAQVNTPISIADIRGAVRSLKAMRARPVTMMMSGSSKYATQPIEGGYVAFAHTDLEYDLRELATFVPVAKYGSRQPLCAEEIGTVENVRFILSPVLDSFADAGAAKGAMKSTSDTLADVYPVIFISKDAYGLVPLKGAGAIKPTVINPDSVSKSDPLGQMGYVGWKTWFAAVRLNEAWMYRLECAVTDL